MKAIEFETTLNSDGLITVPEEFKQSLYEKNVKIIVLYEEKNEKNEWNQLTTAQFLKGYDEEDAIYDSY